jgi:DnaJ-class molecular chaperone
LLIFIGVAKAYAILKDKDLRKTYNTNKKVKIPNIDLIEMFYKNAHRDEVYE